MSTIIANPGRSTVLAPPSPAGVLRRTPFYFESRRQWLFAWLHHREHAAHADHGVVICPPLGYEQIHAHRSLRHLADALAQAEFPVLRFDYHGTGDSSGTDEEPDRYATWLANIRDATEWLHQQLGCKRITLIGVRLGAVLATQAATDQAVDGLLLWAPVVKGRTYVRELKALSLTTNHNPPPTNGQSEDIEAAGFVLTSQTAQDLSRLDLLQAQPRCRRALILTRDDLAADTRLLEHFRAQGINVDQIAAPGFADMMAEPHYTRVPQQSIARIVDWLRAGVSPTDSNDTVGGGSIARSMDLILPPQRLLREQVFPISQQPDLFGILSTPCDTLADDRPFVVLLNAGSCYRVGPNRLHVFLARQLASQGFHCLRMDLCGLGDSVVSDPEYENVTYPATAFRDIDLTLNHLHTQLGVRRVVLLGLCSGAYAAFQAAAQLTNPVLVESVLINPLTFFWKEGMSLETAADAQRLQSFQECMTALWQPGKWWKILSGKSKLGITGILKILQDRMRLRFRFAPKVTPSNCDSTREPFPTHPVQEDLPGDLERIEKAGRHLACFFASSDPGYGLLTFHARRKVKELLRAGKMSVFFIDNADHTFSQAQSAPGSRTGSH